LDDHSSLLLLIVTDINHIICIFDRHRFDADPHPTVGILMPIFLDPNPTLSFKRIGKSELFHTSVDRVPVYRSLQGHRFQNFYILDSIL
jgi:hypothetical protein